MNENTGCVLMLAVCIFGVVTCHVAEQWHDVRMEEIHAKDRAAVLKEVRP